tara:strand:+ start:110 stop:271 length:162 start_codon:yes stop_codon:yes gene_type:complete
MESFNRKLSETNKNAKRCGEINLCNTTRIRMGQEGHSNTFKNTKRNNRLEWRC